LKRETKEVHVYKEGSLEENLGEEYSQNLSDFEEQEGKLICKFNSYL